jgi:hypothetical protein
MNPTRAQLDAALPRVPAGIPAMWGDLTDPEERAVALDWLWHMFCATDTAQDSPQRSREGSEGTQGPLNTQTGLQVSSRWQEVRGDLTVITRSNDWPPPRPGTHESDLDYQWRTGLGIIRWGDDTWEGRGGMLELEAAASWSRNNTPDTPTED